MDQLCGPPVVRQGPTVYTPEGFAVDANTMSIELLRHCPELSTALRGSDNACGPWQVAEGQ